MLTAGETLREKRLQQKLTYTQLSVTIKIPAESLKLIEKSRFNLLPEYAFLKGMIHNYAQALGLNPEKIGAIFRRDYDRERKIKPPVILNKSLSPKRIDKILAKPQTSFFAGLTVLAVLVIGLLWRAYQPPHLVIDSPLDQQTAISPVEIRGRTDRGANLNLNDKTINLKPDGGFSTEFEAEPGEYYLVFRSTSRRQKTSEMKIKIVIIQ